MSKSEVLSGPGLVPRFRRKAPTGSKSDPLKVVITKPPHKAKKRAEPKKDLHYGDNYINVAPLWGGAIDMDFTPFAVGDLYNQRAGPMIQVKSFSGKLIFKNQNAPGVGVAQTVRYMFFQWFPDNSLVAAGGLPPVITDIFVAGQLGTAGSPTAQYNREQIGNQWGLIWDSGPVTVGPQETGKIVRFKITNKQLSRGRNTPKVKYRTGVADITGVGHIYGATVGDGVGTSVEIDGYTRLTFYP